MTCYAIYTRSGSFVCRFSDLERAEFWRSCSGAQKYTIRKEVW